MVHGVPSGGSSGGGYWPLRNRSAEKGAAVVGKKGGSFTNGTATNYAPGGRWNVTQFNRFREASRIRRAKSFEGRPTVAAVPSTGALSVTACVQRREAK